MDPRVLTMLLLVADRGRTRLLGEIARSTSGSRRIARGVRRVTHPLRLPAGRRGEGTHHASALEGRFGGTVELETEVRPSLIGGVVAESEGQEIEFSIGGQLKDHSQNRLMK